MAKWLNGYTLFCNRNRSTVKDENEGKSASEVTSLLAKQWRELDDYNKQKYRKEAELARVVCIIARKTVSNKNNN